MVRRVLELLLRLRKVFRNFGQVDSMLRLGAEDPLAPSTMPPLGHAELMNKLGSVWHHFVQHEWISEGSTHFPHFPHFPHCCKWTLKEDCDNG